MRLTSTLVATTLLLTACTSSTSSTTEDVLVAPASPEGPATTATGRTALSTTQPLGPLIAPIVGALPDGTDYAVYMETTEPEELVGISAWIVLQQEQAAWAIPAVFARRASEDLPTFSEGIYTIPVGEWTVTLEFSDEVLDLLGPGAEALVINSIGGIVGQRGFPTLDVQRPFRWADQYDPTGGMEVIYSTIIIRHGCGDEAIACSTPPGSIIQVIPRAGYEAGGVTIESDPALSPD